MFHRVDLHEELKRLAFGEGQGQPAVLKLGTRVTAVVSKLLFSSLWTITDVLKNVESSSLTLENGQTVTANVIIGADGVHVRCLVSVVAFCIPQLTGRSPR